jgi:hypothetical protein
MDQNNSEQAEQPEPVGQKQYRIGDATISLPGDLDDEQRKKAIGNFLTSPEFEPHIDMQTGAPARVRMLVGSSPEGDRLANIKRFYPDAIPYRDGNFLFTDPGTGKPTLYNPPGFDVVGDTASVAREATQAVFSAGGTVAGTAFGVVRGAPAGPPGMLVEGQRLGMVGAGMGSAFGGELFDLIMNNVEGRIDTRSPVKRTLDAGTEFFAAASGQRVGEMANAGIGKIVSGPGKQAAAKMVAAFRRLKITPPAGAVSGSRTIGTMEKSLEGSPFAADIMQEQAERVLSETKRAASKIVNEIGTPRTSQGAGGVIRKAAEGAAERFGFSQEKAYSAAFDLIGPETLVPLQSVSTLRKTIESELARAPKSLSSALSKAARQLAALEDDAGADGIAFSALRQVRTAIGRNLDNPVLSGSTGAENAAMKRIYGALTEDMSEAAKSVSSEAAKKLQVADRFTRMWMRTASMTMNKIGRMDADEQAFKYALSAVRDGGTTLTRMRRHFTPEEWDVVAASVLNKMGQATPGAQNAAGDAFSVNTFMTNWSRMAPEAKKALFGGKRYESLAPELDTLVEVMGSLKSVEKLANSSNTGRTMITWMTIQALGGGLAGMAVGGDVESGAAGAAATIFAPRAAAKLITSPSFVKWLTTPVVSTGGIPAHLGRLAGIAKAEPELREEIDQFVSALRSAPETPAE